MRTKSLALLILALGCGALAAAGVTRVLAKRNSATPSTVVGDVANIFVAIDEIEVSQELSAQMLRQEAWPIDRIPEGAISDFEDIEGRRPKVKLYPGEPILDMKLIKRGEGGGGKLDRVPTGYRVVPVRVDSVSGGSGLVLPQDRVDVVVYVKDDQLGAKQGIHTVLQNVKVFAVNDTVDIDPSAPQTSMNAQTISLLLTPKEAKKAMLATELGKIRLVLRGPEDNQVEEDADAVGPLALFPGLQDMLPGAEPEPVTEPEPDLVLPQVKTEHPQHHMRMLRGARPSVDVLAFGIEHGLTVSGKPRFSWPLEGRLQYARWPKVETLDYPIMVTGRVGTLLPASNSSEGGQPESMSSFDDGQ